MKMNPGIYILLLTGLLCLNSEKINAQRYDTVAVRIVQNGLKIIEMYQSDKNSSQPSERAMIISFLTNLTGIQSQSDGSWDGQTRSVNLRRTMVLPERLQQKLIN